MYGETNKKIHKLVNEKICRIIYCIIFIKLNYVGTTTCQNALFLINLLLKKSCARRIINSVCNTECSRYINTIA